MTSQHDCLSKTQTTRDTHLVSRVLGLPNLGVVVLLQRLQVCLQAGHLRCWVIIFRTPDNSHVSH